MGYTYECICKKANICQNDGQTMARPQVVPPLIHVSVDSFLSPPSTKRCVLLAKDGRRRGTKHEKTPHTRRRPCFRFCAPHQTKKALFVNETFLADFFVHLRRLLLFLLFLHVYINSSITMSYGGYGRYVSVSKRMDLARARVSLAIVFRQCLTHARTLVLSCFFSKKIQ